MALPIFGLTTYKLKGSILTLPEASDSHEMNSLLKVADVWLKSLKVEVHLDYNHFEKLSVGIRNLMPTNSLSIL